MMGKVRRAFQLCKFYYLLFLHHRKECTVSVREEKNVRDACPSVGASDFVVCHESLEVAIWLQSLLEAAFTGHTLSYRSVEIVLS